MVSLKVPDPSVLWTPKLYLVVTGWTWFKRSMDVEAVHSVTVAGWTWFKRFMDFEAVPGVTPPLAGRSKWAVHAAAQHEGEGKRVWMTHCFKAVKWIEHHLSIHHEAGRGNIECLGHRPACAQTHGVTKWRHWEDWAFTRGNMAELNQLNVITSRSINIVMELNSNTCDW